MRQESGERSKGTPKGTLKGPLPAFDVFLEILRGASLHRAEVADVLGEEFVYVRKVDGPNGPYELELIPFSEISLENYMTLSPTGLSHYVGGVPVSFEPLQRWLNEREAYRSLRKIRFFQAKVGEVPHCSRNPWIEILVFATAFPGPFFQIQLADFCTGLSSYEGLHQLAQCWSSWKNGRSRSNGGRTCFSAAFLVLLLG